jgi:hypothetical protein
VLVVVLPLLLVPVAFSWPSSRIGGVWPILMVIVVAQWWWCWGLLIANATTIGGWWWWWYMGLVLLV